MDRTPRATFFAFLLVAPVVSGAAELTPEIVEKLNGLAEAAVSAYQDGKYAKSNESFLGFLKALPEGKHLDSNRAEAHFRLAGNYALLKEENSAFEHLEKAFQYGFLNLEALEADPDLAQLKKSPKFEPLVNKYRRKAEEKFKEQLFKLRTVDGEELDPKDYQGKVLIVDIWGTWCGPCRMEIPHFIRLLNRYREKGLRIIGINDETRLTPEKEQAAAIVKKFIANNDVNYPCALIDEEILSYVPGFYSRPAFPTTLFIGRDGTFKTKLVGFHPYEYLESVLKPLLAEKVPEVAGSKEESEG